VAISKYRLLLIIDPINVLTNSFFVRYFLIHNTNNIFDWEQMIEKSRGSYTFLLFDWSAIAMSFMKP